MKCILEYSRAKAVVESVTRQAGRHQWIGRLSFLPLNERESKKEKGILILVRTKENRSKEGRNEA